MRLILCFFISAGKDSPREENKEGSVVDEQEETPVDSKTDDVDEEIEDETEPAAKVDMLFLLHPIIGISNTNSHLNFWLLSGFSIARWPL